MTADPTPERRMMESVWPSKPGEATVDLADTPTPDPSVLRTHPRTRTTHFVKPNGWTCCGLRASILGRMWTHEPDRGLGCQRCEQILVGSDD